MKEKHSSHPHGTHHEHHDRDGTSLDVWKLLTVVTLALLVLNLYVTSSVANNMSALNTQILEGSDNAKAGQPGNIKVQEPQNPPTQQPTQQPPQQPPQPTVQVSADDDAVDGDPNAPVTIIEFSDFQCPFCARFYSQTLLQLRENYIDTGKVKLIYRDFPLSFHQQAQPAAEAAECAGEQDKYWEFHDKIFENQGSLSDSSYKQWASELGLNTAQFNDCVDSGKYASEVQKDFTDGQAAGVSGTPTFFINGVKLVGAQPYSVFEQAIEQLLA